MIYDVGAISNRNIQLLYEYRILREPSDNLTAICRYREPEVTQELSWEISDREIEGYDVVYQCEISKSNYADFVPFLEFHPLEHTDWKWIADFIDISVDETGVLLYSSTNYIDSLDISIYWCYSLHHIDSLLTDILSDLKKLLKDYDSLEDEVKNYKNEGAYLSRPVGLVPNLVQINHDVSDIIDSGYRVMQPTSNRLFVNLSQDNLDVMEHIFNEGVEFQFLNTDHYVLDNFISPLMTISGNGDLVLRNIQGQVLLHNWKGTLTIINCTDVHLTAESVNDICVLDKLQISRNSTLYLENQVHQIDNLEMHANSICRHWRGNVKNLDYVGPGCTYWCCAQVTVPGRVQLEEYSDDCNTVFDFNVHDIMGSFICDFDNIMIVAQSNLTPRLGNSDPEPEPGMYVPHWRAEYTRIISET